MSKVLWCRDRGYQTRHLSHLPQEYRLGHEDDEVRFLVDYATTDKLGAMRQMIDEAARRGDNVGIDEYEDGDFHTELLYEISEVFQAKDPDSGSIEAFMVIQPCLYVRTFDSCSASVHVFRSSKVTDVVYGQLLSLMADFSKLIDIGYTQCLAHVALCLPKLQLEIRRQGFLTVAVLPNCVEIKGFGVTENVVMCKLLGLPERPIRSQGEVQKLVDALYPTDEASQQYASVELRKVPGLPKVCNLPNGKTARFRNMRKEEDEVMYRLVAEEMEKGSGFSVHELPSFDCFRVHWLASGYSVVVEEVETKKLIAYIQIQDSKMSRRGAGKVCDPALVISGEFRGKGLLSSITPQIENIAISIGYQHQFLDTFQNNGAVLASWRSADINIVGSIPRAAYQKGVGWIDLVVTSLEYSQIPYSRSQQMSKI